MPRLLKILLVAVLMFALGAVSEWAIWDWRNTLPDYSLAVAVSFVIASAFVLPAFVVYLIREQSISIAWTRAWQFWVWVFSKMFEVLNRTSRIFVVGARRIMLTGHSLVAIVV